MQFALKLTYHVFKYICYPTFVIMKKMWNVLMLIMSNIAVKILYNNFFHVL